jgi:hypothetical protein
MYTGSMYSLNKYQNVFVITFRYLGNEPLFFILLTVVAVIFLPLYLQSFVKILFQAENECIYKCIKHLYCESGQVLPDQR